MLKKRYNRCWRRRRFDSSIVPLQQVSKKLNYAVLEGLGAAVAPAAPPLVTVALPSSEKTLVSVGNDAVGADHDVEEREDDAFDYDDNHDD